MIYVSQSFYYFLTGSFLDVDNVPSPKVSDSVDSGAEEKLCEEIDCLISVDLHTTDHERNQSTTTIPTSRFYSSTKRPKPRASVTIGLKELNAAKRKRRRKGPRLCMPTKRRRKHTFIGHITEGPLDEVCAFVPPERHTSVDSGVDIADNDLFTYSDKYKYNFACDLYLPSRSLGKNSDGLMLARHRLSLDSNLGLLPLQKSSASYRCPCCP